jgi:p90 ribosomal S6 kinase
LNSTYNAIGVDDFDYFEVLAKGSFGLVAKCRKRTTGMMYAMKIIGKAKLIESNAYDTSMVAVEVKMLRALRHPFIIGIYYSFQTSDAALIAMELAQGGTLKSITSYFKDGLMKEHHIRFYIAEIAEALHYLHGLGLVYRDLKPANVLICLNGHVKLAGLGGISEIKTYPPIQIDDDDREVSGMLDLYAYNAPTYVYNDDNLSNPERKRSVLGTRGFMAPEMLELATCNHVAGYSYMSDWWSLGVLAYVLLHGSLPFLKKGERYTIEQELELLFNGTLDMSSNISSEGVSFMCSLLEVADTARLGYGIAGLNNIKHHSFMESFEWQDVMKRACRPPVIPSEHDNSFEANNDCSRNTFSNYESLPLPTWPDEPSAAEQEMFSAWNYISPTTVRIEMGMANAARQYEGNSKLKQLLGDFSSNDSIRSATMRKKSPISLLQSMLSTNKHSGSDAQSSPDGSAESGEGDSWGVMQPICSPRDPEEFMKQKTVSNLPKRDSVLTRQRIST